MAAKKAPLSQQLRRFRSILGAFEPRYSTEIPDTELVDLARDFVSRNPKPFDPLCKEARRIVAETLKALPPEVAGERKSDGL
jgi:hypothetical protein